MLYKRLLVSILLIFVGLISLGVWMSTGLGRGTDSSGPRARVAEDQSATARLIDQRTQERSKLRAAGSLQLENTQKPQEPPDGILYLSARYRENDIDILLDRVEFYPSMTRTYLTVTNESKTDLSLEPAGLLQQNLPGSNTQLELISAPLAPAILSAGVQQQVTLEFPPANGRLPFTLLFGPLKHAGQEWSARYKIDPESIVKSLDN